MMGKIIEIKKNKTLRLDNVLIKKVFHFQTLENSDSQDELFQLDIEVSKMDNVIRSKGAHPVGPLIQYSGTEKKKEENAEVYICLMMQADRFIKNISQGYEMKPLVSVKGCMYTRFYGFERDIKYAYQKMQVEAYENDIELSGDSYTVFVGLEEDGKIIADIFMETVEK